MNDLLAGTLDLRQPPDRVRSVSRPPSTRHRGPISRTISSFNRPSLTGKGGPWERTVRPFILRDIYTKRPTDRETWLCSPKVHRC